MLILWLRKGNIVAAKKCNPAMRKYRRRNIDPAMPARLTGWPKTCLYQADKLG